jgi:DUF1707 SHOCT-like domain
MRVSDTDRQRTIDELRRHCAAGRLDVDEYAARLEKAMAATTLEDLDHLTSDLPIVRIADPAGYHPARVASNGSDRASEVPLPRSSTIAIAVLTVMVVLGALLVAIFASWAWAAVVLVGWVIGLIEGRLFGRRQ